MSIRHTTGTHGNHRPHHTKTHTDDVSMETVTCMASGVTKVTNQGPSLITRDSPRLNDVTCTSGNPDVRPGIDDVTYISGNPPGEVRPGSVPPPSPATMRRSRIPTPCGYVSPLVNNRRSAEYTRAQADSDFYQGGHDLYQAGSRHSTDCSELRGPRPLSASSQRSSQRSSSTSQRSSSSSECSTTSSSQRSVTYDKPSTASQRPSTSSQRSSSRSSTSSRHSVDFSAPLDDSIYRHLTESQPGCRHSLAGTGQRDPCLRQGRGHNDSGRSNQPPLPSPATRRRSVDLGNHSDSYRQISTCSPATRIRSADYSNQSGNGSRDSLPANRRRSVDLGNQQNNGGRQRVTGCSPVSQRRNIPCSPASQRRNIPCSPASQRRNIACSPASQRRSSASSSDDNVRQAAVRARDAKSRNRGLPQSSSCNERLNNHVTPASPRVQRSQQGSGGRQGSGQQGSGGRQGSGQQESDRQASLLQRASHPEQAAMMQRIFEARKGGANDHGNGNGQGGSHSNQKRRSVSSEALSLSNVPPATMRNSSSVGARGLRRMSLDLDGGGGDARVDRSTSLTGDDSDMELLQQWQAAALIPLKEDIAEWITKTIGVEVSVEEFMSSLDSGVLLCQLSHVLHNKSLQQQTNLKGPPAIQSQKVQFRSNAKQGTWFARDNIANFLTWCRGVGVKEECMFETEGLVTHKEERSVILCLLELARIGSRLGIEPPNLVRLEDEIDKEEKSGKSGSATKVKGQGDQSAAKPQKKLGSGKSTDNLDREVQRVTGKCQCSQSFTINRLSEGKYNVNGKTMFVRLLKGRHVMVRVGGGWDTLGHYLATHDPCKIQEFRRQAGGNKYLHIQGKYKS